MNRRGLFKALAGGMVAIGAGWTSLRSVRYGAMTIERHLRFCGQGVHLHVFHQGRDVTTRCVFADDTGEGMAELFVLDVNGRRFFNQRSHEAAKEIVYGVTFRHGAPFR